MVITNVSMTELIAFVPNWWRIKIRVRRLLGHAQEVSGTSLVNSDGTGNREFAREEIQETVGAFVCGLQPILQLRSVSDCFKYFYHNDEIFYRLAVTMQILIVRPQTWTMFSDHDMMEDGISTILNHVSDRNVLNRMMEDIETELRFSILLQFLPNHKNVVL